MTFESTFKALKSGKFAFYLLQIASFDKGITQLFGALKLLKKLIIVILPPKFNLGLLNAYKLIFAIELLK